MVESAPNRRRPEKTGQEWTRRPSCCESERPATPTSPYLVIHPWHKAFPPLAALPARSNGSHGGDPALHLALALPRRRLLRPPLPPPPPAPPPRRAIRVAASAATEAPPKPPPATPSGIILVDPAEAQKLHRLKTVYDTKVVPIITEEFGYTNVHQVPKLEKIVVNCGLGVDAGNNKGLEAAMKDLASITGQYPVKTKAKNSVASFKIREGNTIGIAVTLRGRVMFNFLDRLINLGLPRTMDFLGVNPNSFDGHGNYTIGLRDQGVFPEIPYEVGGKKNGMDVSIVTTAKTDNEAQRLLVLLGMPFAENIKSDQFKKKRLKRHHFMSKGRGRK